MKQQLQLVFELCQLDLKIEEARESLERIGAQREEMEAVLLGKKAALEEKTVQRTDLEKTRRDKEGQVELSQSRLKEFQGKLSQIKTNKEYQAALKEMADTKKSNKEIEDQILELMTKIDQLKKETEALDGSLKEAAASSEKQKADLEAEEKRFLASIEKGEKGRGSFLASLEGKVAGLYQRIRKIRRDAVTFVEGGACQGCHMHIPPQLTIEIQKSKALHTCPSCHRILYLREWQAGPVNPPLKDKEMV